MSNSETTTVVVGDINNSEQQSHVQHTDTDFNDKELVVSPKIDLSTRIESMEQKIRAKYNAPQDSEIYLSYRETQDIVRTVVYDEMCNSDVVSITDSVSLPENETERNEFIDMYLTSPEQSRESGTKITRESDLFKKTYKINMVLMGVFTVISLMWFLITIIV